VLKLSGDEVCQAHLFSPRSRPSIGRSRVQGLQQLRRVDFNQETDGAARRGGGGAIGTRAEQSEPKEGSEGSSPQLLSILSPWNGVTAKRYAVSLLFMIWPQSRAELRATPKSHPDGSTRVCSLGNVVGAEGPAAARRRRMGCYTGNVSG